MARPRIGLIGCGLRGRFHSAGIRGLMKLGLLDADYLVVCDADEERARAFASAARVERFTTDPSEIIRSPEINVVYITVPTAAHKRLVIEAAGAGKHIFCEKPLATNLADVEEMVEAVDAAGVKAGVGLILRHSPILTVLKSLTEDPTLGRLMVIVFRDDQFFPIQGHYMSDWRKDRSVAGSGTLLEHSIHDADVLHWFGGRVERVRGSLSNFAGYEGVEDLATVHLEFESGAFAELVSVWHSVLGRPSTRRLELFYEKGVFFIDHDFLGAIQVQTHARNAELIPEEEVRSRYLAQLGLNNEAFDQALRYSLEDYFFLRSVIDNSEPFPDFHVALQAHRLIDAVYRSAAGKNGEPVSMRGDM